MFCKRKFVGNFSNKVQAAIEYAEAHKAYADPNGLTPHERREAKEREAEELEAVVAHERREASARMAAMQVPPLQLPPDVAALQRLYEALQRLLQTICADKRLRGMRRDHACSVTGMAALLGLSDSNYQTLRAGLEKGKMPKNRCPTLQILMPVQVGGHIIRWHAQEQGSVQVPACGVPAARAQ